MSTPTSSSAIFHLTPKRYTQPYLLLPSIFLILILVYPLHKPPICIELDPKYFFHNLSPFLICLHPYSSYLSKTIPSSYPTMLNPFTSYPIVCNLSHPSEPFINKYSLTPTLVYSHWFPLFYSIAWSLAHVTRHCNQVPSFILFPQLHLLLFTTLLFHTSKQGEDTVFDNVEGVRFSLMSA